MSELLRQRLIRIQEGQGPESYNPASEEDLAACSRERIYSNVRISEYRQAIGSRVERTAARDKDLQIWDLGTVVSDLFQDQKVVDGEPIPQRTIPSRDPYRPWTLHVYVRPDDCTRRPVTRQTTDPSGRIVTSTEYRDVIGIRYDLKGSNGFNGILNVIVPSSQSSRKYITPAAATGSQITTQPSTGEASQDGKMVRASGASG